VLVGQALDPGNEARLDHLADRDISCLVAIDFLFRDLG
jgi:hypothetical protein